MTEKIMILKSKKYSNEMCIKKGEYKDYFVTINICEGNVKIIAESKKYSAVKPSLMIIGDMNGYKTVSYKYPFNTLSEDEYKNIKNSSTASEIAQEIKNNWEEIIRTA